MITITWHLVVMVVLTLTWLAIGLLFDDSDGKIGSARDAYYFLTMPIVFCMWLIYGGAVWW